jgi:AGZA family xanthine/uracil permease-like MFS transporter
MFRQLLQKVRPRPAHGQPSVGFAWTSSNLGKRGTNFRIEVLGGATTFVTMAYIIVLNPAILAHAKLPDDPELPLGAITVATILSAIFGSLLMGFCANRPLAVAPYMGENAFIAFGLVALQITWAERIGAVFVSGAAFVLLTLCGLRSWLAQSISSSMKHSFAVGIGLFLMLIGMYLTGIVSSFVTGMPPEAVGIVDGKLIQPSVPLKIGSWHDARVQVALLGFVLTTVLMYWQVRGAILFGIILTAGIGYVLGLGAQLPREIVALPFTGEYSLSPIALKLNVAGVLRITFLPLLLTLFLMSFLDTLGTLVAVGSAGNMLDEKGNFPEIEKPMLVDGLSCMFSALVGTSTSGAYIESATGIKEGARTGLAAVVTAGLFAVSLFFIPLVQPLQQLTFAYGPALMAVGVLMLPAITKIDFSDLTETVPALATIAMMMFTYNIANGLTAGLVLYPVFKLAAGRFKEINLGSVILALLCLIYFVFGLPH